MPHVLAFDLGGSSLRLALVDADGRFDGFVRLPLEIRHDGDRRFEADPLAWWNAVIEGCEALAGEGHDLATVEAIAGCGFTRTQVFLDGAGTVIRPAIAFQDSRAAEILEDAHGLPETLGPFDPLARLLWLRECEPENWRRLRKVVEPKDFLNYRLTGRAVSDRISQTPMTRSLAADRAGVLAALGLDPNVLPEAISPFEPVGTVLPSLPAPLSKLAGKPVFCGSIDTWACVLGSGGLTPGVAYSISGTSDVSGVISTRPYSAEGLLSIEWGPDLWQLGGPSQGAATRLEWALRRFSPGVEPEAALAAAVAGDRPAPLFLPYLDGERTPWWDPDLQGAFLGLNAEHETGDFLRGVAEGINYLSREILARAEAATGTRVSHVCFSGGLASSPTLCQLKADILDRPVHVAANRETGLVGAARIPRRLREETADLGDGGALYQPDPARRRYHDERFEMFRIASDALAPISHRLRKPGGE